MVSFRDIKRRARSDIHGHMKVRALYLANRTATPVPCYVRVHTSFAALGDMKGTSFRYAEREEFTPTVILWREEIPAPLRNAIISVEAGEAYYVDHVNPADDQTITVTVVPLTDDDAQGLPVPE